MRNLFVIIGAIVVSLVLLLGVMEITRRLVNAIYGVPERDNRHWATPLVRPHES